jgi:hypothetical protein
MITLAQPAQDCGTFDLGCQAGQAVGSAFQGMVTEVARGAAELVVTTATWWVETDSVDPRDPAVVAAQGATRDLILIILVGSVLVQSIRLILSRKGELLVMVATGLVRYAVVSALGLVVLQIALRAGDALASQLLDGAATKFALLMQDLLVNGDGDAVFLVLLVSLIAAVLSLVQSVLMAMRQAGLLVLAAMLPLAASGPLTRSTRGWLDKLMVWLIAMVVYKPAAAFSPRPSSRHPGDAVGLQPLDAGGEQQRQPSAALRANVEFNHVVHEHVVIISVVPENVPHIPPEQRLTIDDLGNATDAIVHIAARFGSRTSRTCPRCCATPKARPRSSTSTRTRRCTSCPTSPSNVAATAA